MRFIKTRTEMKFVSNYDRHPSKVDWMLFGVAKPLFESWVAKKKSLLKTKRLRIDWCWCFYLKHEFERGSTLEDFKLFVIQLGFTLTEIKQEFKTHPTLEFVIKSLLGNKYHSHRRIKEEHARVAKVFWWERVEEANPVVKNKKLQQSNKTAPAV